MGKTEAGAPKSEKPYSPVQVSNCLMLLDFVIIFCSSGKNEYSVFSQ